MQYHDFYDSFSLWMIYWYIKLFSVPFSILSIYTDYYWYNVHNVIIHFNYIIPLSFTEQALIVFSKNLYFKKLYLEKIIKFDVL